MEKEKDDYNNKFLNLLKDLEANKNSFDNLQKIMTKLREKDDIDITLIEERYIVLENVLEQEKNEFLEEASAFFAASRQKYAKKKG